MNNPDILSTLYALGWTVFVIAGSFAIAYVVKHNLDEKDETDSK